VQSRREKRNDVGERGLGVSRVASDPWCKRATGVGSFKSYQLRRRTYTRGSTSIAH
jgi:hypothetical protein